jgi:hypothetical protein
MNIPATTGFIDANNIDSFGNLPVTSGEFSEQIIYCAHARLAYMAPPLYSRRQIFVGPRDETNYSPGAETGFVNTLFGEYSLSDYIEKFKLPAPKVIIVHVDEFQTNLPVDIDDFNCKKIMILGDTHQSSQGLNKVHGYFLEHSFDYYLADCKKNHLHFFYESAPERNYIFFPCFRNRFEVKKFNYKKKKAISLIGQLKSTHPYRFELAEKLKTNGLPVIISEASQPQAAGIYSDFLINVNISLNNDFNMRFIEVISAGGFLLTDRISKQTGYEDVFKENEDFVFFESDQDLLEKIRYYYKHPEKALKIARSGWEKYNLNWSIKKRRRIFENLINSNVNDKLPNFEDDRFLINDLNLRGALAFRMQFYGALQELNKMGFFSVFLPKNVHKIVELDVKDLCRLQFFQYDQIAQIPLASSEEWNKETKKILVADQNSLHSIKTDKSFLERFSKIFKIE